MSLRERIVRFLQRETQQPMTMAVVAGGIKLDYYTKRDPMLDRFRHIYQQGGLVSAGVDCYPLYMLASGFRFEGRKDLIPKAQEFVESFDFEGTMFRLIVDALVVKKGIAEKVKSRDGTKLVTLIQRPAETFEAKTDIFGNIIGYRQHVIQSAKKQMIEIPPERLFSLDLDMPLIERAYDEIIRDTEIADGTSKAIKRHGFPRYHIKIGQSGEAVKEEFLKMVESEFRDLRPQHEMATPRDVDIVNIDSAGIVNTKMYGEWSIDRLCAALGVPNEMLGLGRGSTEATANVRLQGFYKRIETLQRSAAKQLNVQVFDEVTGVPGAVKLVFNDVSPIDEYMRAQVIQMLTGGLDPWAIITPGWARRYLGITIEEEAEVEESPPSPEELFAQRRR